jgi:hypothetical protein
MGDSDREVIGVGTVAGTCPAHPWPAYVSTVCYHFEEKNLQGCSSRIRRSAKSITNRLPRHDLTLATDWLGNVGPLGGVLKKLVFAFQNMFVCEFLTYPMRSLPYPSLSHNAYLSKKVHTLSSSLSTYSVRPIPHW